VLHRQRPKALILRRVSPAPKDLNRTDDRGSRNRDPSQPLCRSGRQGRRPLAGAWQWGRLAVAVFCSCSCPFSALRGSAFGAALPFRGLDIWPEGAIMRVRSRRARPLSPCGSGVAWLAQPAAQLRESAGPRIAQPPRGGARPGACAGFNGFDKLAPGRRGPRRGGGRRKWGPSGWREIGRRACK